MSYTSWGTRKALGRRYGVDPAILLEQQRLEQQYGLAPGREARALQSKQYQLGLEQQDKALAQQNAQFETNRSDQKSAGMWGTAANLAQSAAVVRGMTKAKGEPFFGNWGTTPTTSAVQGTSLATTPSASYASLMPSAGGYEGALTEGAKFAVNPALMPEATAGVGMGAAETAATTGATEGLTGTMSSVAPYVLPAYLGGKAMESVASPGTFAHRAGEAIPQTLEWPIKMITDPGKTWEKTKEFFGDAWEPVQDFFGGVADVFGW